MMRQIPPFLLSPEQRIQHSKVEKRRQHLPFIDRTLRKIADFIKTGYLQAETASKTGILQKTDARVKLLFMLCFAVQANIVRLISSQLLIALFLFAVCAISRLSLFGIYKKVLIFSFFFGFLVIVPAALNVITDGKIVLHLWQFASARHFWIYHIPAEIGITWEGILVVTRLYLKVFNSLTITLLIFSTTPFNEMTKALKFLKVPDMFLLIITMTYKFIFILAHTVQETYFALKLRWWKKVENSEARKIIAGRIIYTFRKSWRRYEEVFNAMLARGFTGEFNFYYLRKLTFSDFAFTGLFATISVIIYLI